jgi:hypothetical protein
MGANASSLAVSERGGKYTIYLSIALTLYIEMSLKI